MIVVSMHSLVEHRHVQQASANKAAELVLAQGAYNYTLRHDGHDQVTTTSL